MFPNIVISKYNVSSPRKAICTLVVNVASAAQRNK
jgi:hypothetical protein